MVRLVRREEGGRGFGGLAEVKKFAEQLVNWQNYFQKEKQGRKNLEEEKSKLNVTVMDKI